MNMTQVKDHLCRNCAEDESKTTALTEYIMKHGDPKTKLHYTYDPIEKVGHLKGNWFDWHVERSDGIHGTMQADGQFEMKAEDTFEED